MLGIKLNHVSKKGSHEGFLWFNPIIPNKIKIQYTWMAMGDKNTKVYIRHPSTPIYSQWGGGYKANFLRSVIFRIFHYYHNTRFLLNITFIFERCRRSSDAEVPVKYKCDSNNLRGSIGRSKILLTEKFTNGGLVTPTPGLLMSSVTSIY